VVYAEWILTLQDILDFAERAFVESRCFPPRFAFGFGQCPA